MEQLYTFLKNHFPVLFSPRFWGIVGTAFFILATKKQWLDRDWMEFFSSVFGFGTAVGITGWVVKKATTLEVPEQPAPSAPADETPEPTTEQPAA